MSFLRALAEPRQIQRLLSTGLTRGVGALGGLILSFLVGRYLGTAGLGAFAFAHAVCIVTVIVSRRGYDTVLMRTVSRSLAARVPDRAGEALRFALRGVALLALVASVGVALFVWLNPSEIVSAGARRLLLIMLVSVVPLALLWQFSGFYKGLHRASLGIIFENGGAAVVATLLFYVAITGGLRPSLSLLGISFVCGTLVLLLLAVVIYRRWARALPPLDEPIGDARLDHLAFDASGREFLAINLGVYMMQAGSFLFAGLILPEADVGLLKAAALLTLAVSFWSSVVNPIVAPKIAALHQQERYSDIGLAARKASLFCLLASVPFAVVLFFAPRFALELFGPEFGEAAGFLKIMALGHFVAVSMDPSFYVLTMSGYEEITRRITLALLGLSVLAFPAMMLLFGALGFAVANSFFIVAKNVAIVVFTWRKMQLWTLAGPDLGPWIAGGRVRSGR